MQINKAEWIDDDQSDTKKETLNWTICYYIQVRDDMMGSTESSMSVDQEEYRIE